MQQVLLKTLLWKNSHNEVYEESFVVMVVLSELGWCWRRRRVDCFPVVKSKTREIATFWIFLKKERFVQQVLQKTLVEEFSQ